MTIAHLGIISDVDMYFVWCFWTLLFGWKLFVVVRLFLVQLLGWLGFPWGLWPSTVAGDTTQGARRTNIHQNKRDKIICQKYICIIKQQMFHRIKCFVFSILFIKFLEPVYRLLPITFVQEIALCWAYSSKTKLVCNIDCYNRYKSAFCRLSNIQRHQNWASALHFQICPTDGSTFYPPYPKNAFENM